MKSKPLARRRLYAISNIKRSRHITPALTGVIAFFITLVIVSASCTAQAQSQGDNDPSFNPSQTGMGFGEGANSTVRVNGIQSDGKIIIGGDFTSCNGTTKNGISRLNTDGTLDETFNIGTGVDGHVFTISAQSDGKIIIGGYFTTYNGIARNCITRLNTDGSIDGTFNIGTGTNSTVTCIVLQSDGKIIIGGDFTSCNGTARNYIARLNSDGTLDGTFNVGTGSNGTVRTIAIQNDGKIIIGGEFTSYNGTGRNHIARLNTDGTLDGTFSTGSGADGYVYAAAIQSDGKIIIGGEFTSYDGTGRNHIARLNTDGAVDGAFSIGSGTDGSGVNTIVVQNNGEIIIGGKFSNYNGTARNNIARLNTDGTIDGTFNIGSGAGAQVSAMALQGDGKIIVGGYFIKYNGTSINRIARLNTDGTIDETFNIAVGANDWVNSISLQSDGKIIIGGRFIFYNGTSRNHVTRLNTDGTVDATFTVGLGANDVVQTTALQNDGKIIIAGDFTNYNGKAMNRIARLNANGTLDSAFNIGTGVPRTIYTTAIQRDGKIIIAGYFSSYNGTYINSIARLNTDGTLDSAFYVGSGVAGPSFASLIQSDDKIIIAGYFVTYNGIARNYIARLNTNGTLDSTFNIGTGANNTIYTASIQSDGKIIIGGDFTSYNGTASNHIARLNPDGTLDSTFNVGTGANYRVGSTVLQSDGKIIIGGDFTSYNGTASNHIARLNTSGSIDGIFNPGMGANGSVNTCAIQHDGRIIIGGTFTAYKGTVRNHIARIMGDDAVDIPEIETNNQPLIYPNPTRGVFQIQANGIQPTAIRIYNAMGEKVYARDLSEQRVANTGNTANNLSLIPVNLSSQPGGVYFLSIKTSNGNVVKKIIKE